MAVQLQIYAICTSITRTSMASYTMFPRFLKLMESASDFLFFLFFYFLALKKFFVIDTINE